MISNNISDSIPSQRKNLISILMHFLIFSFKNMVKNYFFTSSASSFQPCLTTFITLFNDIMVNVLKL